MATATHTTEQRAFIIQRLVRKQSPDTIVAEFARRFKGVTCTAEDVAACERRVLPADWQAYFDYAREEYLDAPASAQEFRIAMLSETALHAKERGAIDPMFRALEMIAKEQGVGAYAKAGGKVEQPGAPGTAEPVVTITRTIVYPAAPAPDAT